MASDALCRARPLPAGQGGLGASARTASTGASSKAAASSIQDAFGWRVTLFSPSRRRARPSPLARKRRNESSRSHLPDRQAACAVVCDRSRGQGGVGPNGARRPLQPTTIREHAPLARSPEPRASSTAPRGRPKAAWGSQASLPELRSCLRRPDVAWCRVAPPHVSAMSPKAHLEHARNDSSRGFTGQRPRCGLCPLGALSVVIAHAARLLRHRDCSRGEASPQPDPLGHLLS